MIFKKDPPTEPKKLRWLVPLNGGCALKEEKVEPPEMAVFSFIDLPDVLTHEKKGEHIMKKDKLSKEAQHLDSKINELAGTTTRKLKKVRSEGLTSFMVIRPSQKYLKQRSRNGSL